MRILIIENGLSSSYIAFRYSVWYRSQKNEAYSSTQAELMQTMIVALGLGGIVDSIESNRKQKKIKIKMAQKNTLEAKVMQAVEISVSIPLLPTLSLF